MQAPTLSFVFLIMQRLVFLLPLISACYCPVTVLILYVTSVIVYFDACERQEVHWIKRLGNNTDLTLQNHSFYISQNEINRT